MSEAVLWKCRWPVPVYSVGVSIVRAPTTDCARFVYQQPGLPAPKCPGGHVGLMESHGVFDFEEEFA